LRLGRGAKGWGAWSAVRKVSAHANEKKGGQTGWKIALRQEVWEWGARGKRYVGRWRTKRGNFPEKGWGALDGRRIKWEGGKWKRVWRPYWLPVGDRW